MGCLWQLPYFYATIVGFAYGETEWSFYVIFVQNEEVLKELQHHTQLRSQTSDNGAIWWELRVLGEDKGILHVEEIDVIWG